MSFSVASGDGLLVGRQVDEVLGARDDLLPVAVIRGQEVTLPGQVGALRPGDRLILAGSEPAYAEFMEIHRPAQETD